MKIYGRSFDIKNNVYGFFDIILMVIVLKCVEGVL